MSESEKTDEQPVAEKSKSKKRENVTFYLYDFNGNLDTRTKIIYSPFNIKTYGRDKSEDGYRDPKIVTFEGGVYATDDPEDIEFLDMWNRGGRLSNDKKFNGDTVHKIKREKPAQIQSEKIVKETVEVQTIPTVVAEAMTVDQLKLLCKNWKVSVPKEFTGEVKEELIKLLSDSGHVQN